jgi:penicillin-binding protein 1A
MDDFSMNTEQEPIPIREQRLPTYRKIIKWLWRLTFAGIVGVAVLFVFLSNQDLPTFEELENPKSNLASEVYAANGEVLGRYYYENRVPVAFEELSPYIEHALISTEDERYFRHSGIDFEGLIRVAIKTGLMGQKSAGGASTITQQLAKMLFTEKPGSGFERVVQKLKEWIIAIKLERSYTKQEIIAMYLNKFNFINGAYGIKAASEIYFDKSQDSLSIEESATLVGMLKNPALFNPIRRIDTVRHRRMVVLKQMQKNEFISQEQYDSLKSLPLDMTRFSRKTHADGLAPYFRMELRKELIRILNEEENRKTDGTKYDIYKDGLKIYTTLDPVIQEHAEKAMIEHMSQQQKTFDKHWKGKDPWKYNDPTKEKEENQSIDRARKAAFKNALRGTDRYLSMRHQFMDEILDKIAEEFEGFQLKDHEIERIIQEDKKKGLIARLVSRKMISSERAVKYRNIHKSPNFPELKENWEALQKRVKEVFNEPTEMKVFAYNDKMEKDTVMSPSDSIKYHHNFLQFGSLAIDPITGHVKAWVGGINHKYFQYDHVTSERQVGSTFKPFIYATAIAQQGISPCFTVFDLPYTIHQGEGNFDLLEDWTPNNADGTYTGNPYTLFKALQWSKNTVSVFLMKQLGDTKEVRSLAKGMGIDVDYRRSNGSFKVPKQPSICLGSSDLTVMEMTGAYTTFANNGTYNKPIFITRIEDKNGNKIFEAIIQENRALNPNANFVMLEMLRKVLHQGTPGFSGVKSDLGGKTGTTNDYVDGWFMGLTPNLVVGTWVGGDDRWVRFRSLQYGIGGKMARPYFGRLLKRIEADPNADYDASLQFYRPKGDIGIEIDCEVYKQDHHFPGSSEEGEENEDFGGERWGDEKELIKKDSLRENEDF